MPNPFQSVAYLQIRRKWVSIQTITWAGRSDAWSGVPEVMLMADTRNRLHAYAADDPKIVNAVHARPFTAFSHSRVVFDCFEETRLAMGVYLKKGGWRPGSGSWIFVFHSRDEWLEGLTDIEHRALTELGRKLGAGKVLILRAGRELTPPEVLQIARGPHPAGGQQPIALDHL